MAIVIPFFIFASLARIILYFRFVTVNTLNHFADDLIHDLCGTAPDTENT